MQVCSRTDTAWCRRFISHWLLNTLSALYDEVTTYKQSVVQSDADALSDSYTNSSLNGLATTWTTTATAWMDGRAGFHGMGIISMSEMTERCLQSEYTELALCWLQRQMAERVNVNRGIAVVPYIATNMASLSLMQLKPFVQLETLVYASHL